MLLERIRFMKVNRNRRFDYTPRYYDERKERIEHLKALYSEDEDASEEHRQLRREKLQSAWNTEKTYAKQSRAANIRLIVILIILIVAAYIVLGNINIFTADIIDISNP